MHEYFDDDSDLSLTWESVITSVKLAGMDVSEEDQRVVLATLASYVFDLMSDKVKRYENCRTGSYTFTGYKRRESHKSVSIWWICPAFNDIKTRNSVI